MAKTQLTNHNEIKNNLKKNVSVGNKDAQQSVCSNSEESGVSATNFYDVSYNTDSINLIRSVCRAKSTNLTTEFGERNLFIQYNEVGAYRKSWVTGLDFQFC